MYPTHEFPFSLRPSQNVLFVSLAMAILIHVRRDGTVTWIRISLMISGAFSCPCWPSVCLSKVKLIALVPLPNFEFYSLLLLLS